MTVTSAQTQRERWQDHLDAHGRIEDPRAYVLGLSVEEFAPAVALLSDSEEMVCVTNSSVHLLSPGVRFQTFFKRRFFYTCFGVPGIREAFSNIAPKDWLEYSWFFNNRLKGYMEYFWVSNIPPKGCVEHWWPLAATTKEASQPYGRATPRHLISGL